MVHNFAAIYEYPDCALMAKIEEKRRELKYAKHDQTATIENHLNLMIDEAIKRGLKFTNPRTFIARFSDGTFESRNTTSMKGFTHAARINNRTSKNGWAVSFGTSEPRLMKLIEKWNTEGKMESYEIVTAEEL